MLVGWSKHDGRGDPDGWSLIDYLVSNLIWKPAPSGGRRLEERLPAPEILAGDYHLLQSAIESIPFERRYTSSVLSFAGEDLDVGRFNAGDVELRSRVSEIIRRFEDAAFAGIPIEARPPTLWTTHTHLGRLELNFACPRAINLRGVRSYNPAPPGVANTRLWDAFRDYFNTKFGMADPDDPARARSVKVPDHILKRRASEKRHRGQVELDIREKLDVAIVKWIAAGKISCRQDILTRLREIGLEVPRAGKDYITVVDPATGRRCRLRGLIWSESFTSLQAIGAERNAAKRDYSLSRSGVEALEQQLDKLIEARAAFNTRRFRLSEGRKPEVEGMKHNTSEPVGRIIPTTVDIKARLLQAQTGALLPPEMIILIRWVELSETSPFILLVDGSRLIDTESEITSDSSTESAAMVAVALAKTKGWSTIIVSGDPEFIRLVRIEAARQGVSCRTEAEIPPVAANGNAPAVPAPAAEAAAPPAEKARPLISLPIASNTHARDLEGPGRSHGRIDYREEIERFKTEIDLRELAAGLGYSTDQRASSQNHTVMRSTTGHKLIIGRATSGHWVYSDNVGTHGSAIDLLTRHCGMSFGDACRHLRQALRGHEVPRAGAGQANAGADRRHFDPMAGQTEWDSSTTRDYSIFLEQSRGINRAVQNHERFKGSWRTDGRHNVVFPYRGPDGAIWGVERRNRPPAGSSASFKSYSKGGRPGLWTSNQFTTDTELVVVESPIDAMAYFQQCPSTRRAGIRYVAIRNGTPDDLVRQVIEQMPVGSTITIATDRDAAGEAYADRITKLVSSSFNIRRERPAANDWNEEILSRRNGNHLNGDPGIPTL